MCEMNEILYLNNLLQEEATKYYGMTLKELKEKLDVETTAKHTNFVIIQKIIDNSINSSIIKELLNKCNCILKTVNFEWNNNLKESMSLSAFKFCEIVLEDWEKSKLRSYFDKHIFVFVVFKKGYSDTIFEAIKVWKMPTKILDSDVRETWLKTQKLIKEGRIVNYVDNRNRNITLFPTSGDTKYIHVRPHARDSGDTYPLPTPDRVTGKTEFTKHSFWINSNFIKKIVIEGKYYE